MVRPLKLRWRCRPQITLGPSVRVRCQGRIQRCVLNPGESAGIATKIEKYEFLSGSEEVA